MDNKYIWTRSLLLQKAKLVIGIALPVLGIVLSVGLPTVGTPLYTEKRGSTTVRYWATQEERNRAEERKEKGKWVFIILGGGALLIVDGIRCLRKAK
jgi:hypothetical protein